MPRSTEGGRKRHKHFSLLQIGTDKDWLDALKWMQDQDELPKQLEALEQAISTVLGRLVLDVSLHPEKYEKAAADA